MYKLFTEVYEGNPALLHFPAFDYIKRTYQRELEKVIDYFQTRVYAVKSNHILCRVLTSTSLPLSYEVDRFMEVVYARSPYVAKHFNFTSDIQYGKFHDGLFYGEGNLELILSTENYFNPYDQFANWKDIEAVKVLTHNVSHINLMLPNGNKNDSGEGIVSIAIDLPLLFLQFKGFMNQQYMRYQDGGQSALGVTHFVNMYVLPKMLKSHLECVILNRLMNLFYGAPMSEPLKKLPFLIVDYHDKLDNVLYEVIRHLRDNQMWYVKSLMNIPSVFNENMQVSMQMPDISRTRQAWWALFLSRWKLINFLIDIGGIEGIKNNGSTINRLKVDIKEMGRTRIIKTFLPEDMVYDIQERMEMILAL